METDKKHRRIRYRFSAWHLVFPCLFCLSISLWLTVRPFQTKLGVGAQKAADQHVRIATARTRTTPPRPRVLTPSKSSPSARTLSSERFRARFSVRVERREVESVLRTLEAARRDVARRTAAASVPSDDGSLLDVVIHDTTGDFVAATGQPWWAAAVTHDHQIELQPLEILRSRGVLDQTLKHEYAHIVIENLSGGNAPRWLAEGLAAHIAGEGAMLERGESTVPTEQLTIEEIEEKLSQPGSADEMRGLYLAAYREVSSLIRAEGEAGIWRRLMSDKL